VPGPRTVICDDAFGYRVLTRRWLEDADFDVVGEAGSWEEAETVAAEHQPELVVADLWMPTFEPEALQRLRAAASGAALVSLSGLSVEAAQEAAGDTGAIDLFLSKAQPPAEMVDELKAFLADRAA
jgi:response regulator NasT